MAVMVAVCEIVSIRSQLDHSERHDRHRYDPPVKVRTHHASDMPGNVLRLCER